MARGITHGNRILTYGGRPLLYAGSVAAPSQASTFEVNIDGATELLRIEPTTFSTASGLISRTEFETYTPFNSGHWKITDDRFFRETISSTFSQGPSKEAIRFRDPKLDEGGSTSPWFRRMDPAIDWGATTLVDEVVGSDVLPGTRAFTELGLYFPQHDYGNTDPEGWSAGFTIKWWDGWSLGGVGSTGNNPQTSTNVCEIVLTQYGIKTLQNNSYNLNSKGDFGTWETGITTIDSSGTYNPVIDINNTDHFQNYFFLGWGIYAHDTRITYNFQEMLYPTWPGTNHRILFRTGVEYDMRWTASLETTTSAPHDGTFFCEMRIRHVDSDVSVTGNGTGAASLPPGINIDEWFTVKELTDVDWRGNGGDPWRDNGFIFFAGGGSGDSWGDNSYHPTPKPPYYDRQVYITHKINSVK